MTVKQVMQYRRAEPFQPFVVQLKDGREFVVRQPEQVGRNADYSLMAVAADEDSVITVDEDSIAGVRLITDQLQGDSDGKKQA